MDSIGTFHGNSSIGSSVSCTTAKSDGSRIVVILTATELQGADAHNSTWC